MGKHINFGISKDKEGNMVSHPGVIFIKYDIVQKQPDEMVICKKVTDFDAHQKMIKDGNYGPIQSNANPVGFINPKKGKGSHYMAQLILVRKSNLDEC